MSGEHRRQRQPPRCYLSVAALLLLELVGAAAARADTAEVDALLLRLEQSGCEFRRHGEWYGPAAASEHLRMKHRYLLRLRPALSTEEFIALAASGSSTSRQPYRVRCTGVAERSGAEWMAAQLRELRARDARGQVR